MAHQLSWPTPALLPEEVRVWGAAGLVAGEVPCNSPVLAPGAPSPVAATQPHLPQPWSPPLALPPSPPSLRPPATSPTLSFLHPSLLDPAMVEAEDQRTWSRAPGQ